MGGSIEEPIIFFASSVLYDFRTVYITFQRHKHKAFVSIPTTLAMLLPSISESERALYTPYQFVIYIFVTYLQWLRSAEKGPTDLINVIHGPRGETVRYLL